jgi:predicted negative regulator of RcsB-dependent stress response
MNGHWFKLVEFFLFFGVVFGWGFWELHKLRKLRREDERKSNESPAAQRDQR